MFSNKNVYQKYSYHCLRISKAKNFLFPHHNNCTSLYISPNFIFIFNLQKTNFYSTFNCFQFLLCNSYKTEQMFCLQHCCKYQYSSCHSNTFSVLLHTQHFSTLWISLCYQHGHQYYETGRSSATKNTVPHRAKYGTTQSKIKLYQTNIWVEQLMNYSSFNFWHRQEIFPLLQSIQTSSWTYLASYYMGNKCPFLVSKAPAVAWSWPITTL